MIQTNEPEWRVIEELSISDYEYPIRPKDVPADGEPASLTTFGTSEVEEVVWHLLAFFKSRGYWCSFTIDELSQFYREHKWNPNTMFYGLMGGYMHYSGPFLSFYERRGPFFVVDPDGKYYVTNLFLDQCCRNLKKEKVA